MKKIDNTFHCSYITIKELKSIITSNLDKFLYIKIDNKEEESNILQILENLFPNLYWLYESQLIKPSKLSYYHKLSDYIYCLVIKDNKLYYSYGEYDYLQLFKIKL